MSKEKLYYVSAIQDVAMAIRVRAKNEPEALRKAIRGEWESHDYIVQHSYTDPYGFHVEGVCNEEDKEKYNG